MFEGISLSCLRQPRCLLLILYEFIDLKGICITIDMRNNLPVSTTYRLLCLCLLKLQFLKTSEQITSITNWNQRLQMSKFKTRIHKCLHSVPINRRCDQVAYKISYIHITITKAFWESHQISLFHSHSVCFPATYFPSTPRLVIDQGSLVLFLLF